MGFRDRLRHGQPYPRAACAAGAGFIYPVKAVKQPGQNLFLLRQFSSKIRTLRFTLGTLTSLFVLALLGCAIAMMFNDFQNQILINKWLYTHLRLFGDDYKNSYADFGGHQESEAMAAGSDSARYRFRYRVLHQIGLGQREISAVILRQLAGFYLCPILFAAVISGIIAVYVGWKFNFYTGTHTAAIGYFRISFLLCTRSVSW